MIKICLLFLFLFSKYGQNCFWSEQVKNNFLLLFKHSTTCVSFATFQNIKENKICAHFRVTVNIFRGPWTLDKLKYFQKFFGFGVLLNNLAQRDECPIFFFKTHSTLIYTYTVGPHKKTRYTIKTLGFYFVKTHIFY